MIYPFHHSANRYLSAIAPLAGLLLTTAIAPHPTYAATREAGSREASVRLATAASEIRENLDYAEYTNPRYNYSVVFPSDLVSTNPIGDRSDGLRFTSDSGDIVMTVSASTNNRDLNIEQLFEAELDAEPRRITYQRQLTDAFVVSGYGDDVVFYTKTMLVDADEPGEENIVTLALTYDRRLQPEFDRVVARIANSLSQSDTTDENEQRTVAVYFPDVRRESFDAVERVNRRTTRRDVAHFALEELAQGPTPRERERGLSDPLDFEGESTCYDRDFTISLEDGEARVQFCRQVPLAGVGDVARLETAVRETLTQFDNISDVTLLNDRGDCFGDFSGRNLCLQDEDPNAG